MTIVWAGRAIEVPGIDSRSWVDPVEPPPRSPNVYTNVRGDLGAYRPDMVQPVTGIVWHTVHGTATGEVLRDGTCGTSSEAYAYAADFAKPSREASSTFIVADNGRLLALSDLITARSWHAGPWNPWTVGIEIDQHSAGGICAAAIDTAVRLAWWLSEAFGVQPMVAVRPDGQPDLSDIPRLQGEGARSFHGHYFHADQPVRSTGDPGPAFARAFMASGAEGFDVARDQDIQVWKARQDYLGLPVAEQDGIPGARTVAAIEARFGRRTWQVNPFRSSGSMLPVLGLAGAAAAAWWAVPKLRAMVKRRRRRRR